MSMRIGIIFCWGLGYASLPFNYLAQIGQLLSVQIKFVSNKWLDFDSHYVTERPFVSLHK